MILDPFGGVGLGGYHALQNGMRWVGVELEPAFVRLGSGYDCSGFSQADWMIRQQMNEEDQKNFEIHLCPTCQKTIAGEKVMGLLLEQAPHHFEGNIDLWNRRYGRHFRKWGTARLVQGDSRQLREIVKGAVDGICSSPPFLEAQSGGGIADTGTPHMGKASSTGGYRADQQGQSPGQLAQMPPGSVDATITSPPFSQPETRNRKPVQDGSVSDFMTRAYTVDRQGTSEGNIAKLPPGDADVVITSSPYAGSLERKSGIDTTKIKRPGGPHSQAHVPDTRYGESEGQLAGMKEGDLILTSPPWEGVTAMAGNPNYDWKFHGDQSSYGDTAGQIGKESGDTFWSAAKTIVQECHEILKPAGVAVFVTKRFVRDKKIVQFSDQWRQLCESCGFELVEWIKAWLIEDRGTQYDLWGGKEKREVKRMSFFRRLHASKYPHLSIDWEDVLIFRKPKDD